MKIINPSVELGRNALSYFDVLDSIEEAARTCYKSEDSKSSVDKMRFVKNLIVRGHHAMLEFATIPLKITTDRGIAQEITRHRVASYAMESTRYCNYANDRFENQVQFVKPINIKPGTKEYDIWEKACKHAEERYLEMVTVHKVAPQDARSVLPLCTKCDIHVLMNVRELRHFLALRYNESTGKVHPDMLYISNRIAELMLEEYPVLFEDVVGQRKED